MKRFWALFLCFCFWVFPSRAETIAENSLFSRFIRNLDSVSVRYRQTKRIPDLEKVFVSEGRIKLAKDKGVLWMQDKPAPERFVATMAKYCRNGQTEDVEQLPYFSMIKRLTDDVLAGDYQALDNIFAVDYAEVNEVWKLLLVPTRDEMSVFLKKIVLTGTADGISRAVFFYASGIKMTIDFKQTGKEIADAIEC